MGSVVGEITGANKRAAKSAGKAARAQEASARSQQERLQATQAQALDLASSPQELQALEQSLGAQQKQLERSERLVQALDPAILEASSQALGILQGKETKALQPLREQRERQRKRLLDQLREQMGPGAETSSAGQQALQQFDIQTSEQLQTTQQGSLSQLFGLGSFADTRASQAAGGLAQIGQGFGQRAGRQSGILSAFSGAQAQAGQAVTGSAGSRFVESGLRAQQQQAVGGDLLQAANAGLSAFTGGLGGGGGGGGAFSGLTSAFGGDPAASGTGNLKQFLGGNPNG